jgi:hypothetical protein
MEWANTEEVSLPMKEYALTYLKDQFAPLMWVEGVTEEAIEAAFNDAGEDAALAWSSIKRIADENM